MSRICAGTSTRFRLRVLDNAGGRCPAGGREFDNPCGEHRDRPHLRQFGSGWRQGGPCSDRVLPAGPPRPRPLAVLSLGAVKMNKRRIQVPTTRCAAWLGPHELIILAELSGGSVGESQPARVALMVKSTRPWPVLRPKRARTASGLVLLRRWQTPELWSSGPVRCLARSRSHRRAVQQGHGQCPVLPVPVGKVGTHPCQQFDRLFPHVNERHRCVGSCRSDSVENRFMMRGPVAEPLEQRRTAVHVGPGRAPRATRGREGACREAETERWTPQPGLVVDRTAKRTMSASTQESDPDSEGRVGDNPARAYSSFGDLLLVPLHNFREHVVGYVIQLEGVRRPPVRSTKMSGESIVDGVAERHFEVGNERGYGSGKFDIPPVQRPSILHRRGLSEVWSESVSRDRLLETVVEVHDDRAYI